MFFPIKPIKVDYQDILETLKTLNDLPRHKVKRALDNISLTFDEWQVFTNEYQGSRYPTTSPYDDYYGFYHLLLENLRPSSIIRYKDFLSLLSIPAHIIEVPFPSNIYYSEFQKKCDFLCENSLEERKRLDRIFGLYHSFSEERKRIDRIISLYHSFSEDNIKKFILNDYDRDSNLFEKLLEEDDEILGLEKLYYLREINSLWAKVKAKYDPFQTIKDDFYSLEALLHSVELWDPDEQTHAFLYLEWALEAIRNQLLYCFSYIDYDYKHNDIIDDFEINVISALDNIITEVHDALVIGYYISAKEFKSLIAPYYYILKKLENYEEYRITPQVLIDKIDRELRKYAEDEYEGEEEEDAFFDYDEEDEDDDDDFFDYDEEDEDDDDD